MKRPLPKLVSMYRAWTKRDDVIVRARYLLDGPSEIAKRLDRSWFSIAYRARKLGIAIRRRRWTTEERAFLRQLWGTHTLRSLAKKMGRTVDGIYEQGRFMGLPMGCRPGHEYLTAAARRTGYHVASLRRILRWARVSIVLTMARPSKSHARHHCVWPIDVDDAVGRWCAAETPGVAARRLGLVPGAVRKALAKSTLKLPPRPKRYRQWQVPSELIDQALADRSERAA